MKWDSQIVFIFCLCILGYKPCDVIKLHTIKSRGIVSNLAVLDNIMNDSIDLLHLLLQVRKIIKLSDA